MDTETKLKNSQYSCLIGPAGSGKTYLTRKITDENTAIITPTGISALTVGGQTAHSAFQLPFGIPTEADRNKTTPSMEKLFGNSGVISRLVLDEAFMLRAVDLDTIDNKLRKIRKTDEPFGGLPVLFVGDPFQIEPVVRTGERRFLRKLGYKKSQFIFDSHVWDEMDLNVVKLTKIYRQEDPAQVALLNSLRTKDKYWREAIVRLNEWTSQNEVEDPLYICAYRRDTDKINSKRYKENPNKEYVFQGKRKGNFRESDLMVPETLKLKKGLKIIMCANDREAGYLNGEMGYICEIGPNEIWVDLEGHNEPLLVVPYKWESYKYSPLMGSLTKVVTGEFTQFPVKQANAITAHKSQSTTLDNVCVHLGSGAFSAGLTYVALSRVRSLRNMTLWRPIEEDDIIVSRVVSEWYNSIG